MWYTSSIDTVALVNQLSATVNFQMEDDFVASNYLRLNQLARTSGQQTREKKDHRQRKEGRHFFSLSLSWVGNSVHITEGCAGPLLDYCTSWSGHLPLRQASNGLHSTTCVSRHSKGLGPGPDACIPSWHTVTLLESSIVSPMDEAREDLNCLPEVSGSTNSSNVCSGVGALL